MSEPPLSSHAIPARTDELRSRYDVVIVGGGFAGAATAWALSERGVDDVLVVDREPVCGAHASGRNAGMIRTAVEDPVIAPLAREGRAAIERLVNDPRHPVRYRPCGSLLLGAEGRIPAEVIRDGDHEFVTPGEAVERVPLLAGGVRSPVLWTSGDGIVEVHSLLQHYLATSRDRGITVVSGCDVVRPHVANGRVRGVEFEGRQIEADQLVVAAGAWAGEWGARVGVGLDLEPRRRHIVCTQDPADQTSRTWPWVWDIARGFYFRPESCGLLWSPCDEQPQAAGAPTPDPDAALWLAEKIAPRFVAASSLPATRVWAGQRTFAPDGRFVLGPDPRVVGWHWAVGLGGHGVTVSAAVGQRVAASVVGLDAVEPEFAVRPSVLGERVAS